MRSGSSAARSLAARAGIAIESHRKMQSARRGTLGPAVEAASAIRARDLYRCLECGQSAILVSGEQVVAHFRHREFNPACQYCDERWSGAQAAASALGGLRIFASLDSETWTLEQPPVPIDLVDYLYTAPFDMRLVAPTAQVPTKAEVWCFHLGAGGLQVPDGEGLFVGEEYAIVFSDLPGIWFSRGTYLGKFCPPTQHVSRRHALRVFFTEAVAHDGMLETAGLSMSPGRLLRWQIGAPPPAVAAATGPCLAVLLRAPDFDAGSPIFVRVEGTRPESALAFRCRAEGGKHLIECRSSDPNDEVHVTVRGAKLTATDDRLRPFPDAPVARQVRPRAGAEWSCETTWQLQTGAALAIRIVTPSLPEGEWLSRQKAARELGKTAAELEELARAKHLRSFQVEDRGERGMFFKRADVLSLAKEGLRR